MLIESWRWQSTPEPGAPALWASPSCERRYYLSSVEPQAPRLLQASRAHWGIENQVHWVLDVAFDEDASRIRSGHAARNMGTLRRLALNLLRRDTQHRRGIKTRRHRAGWDSDYLLRILGGA